MSGNDDESLQIRQLRAQLNKLIDENLLLDTTLKEVYDDNLKLAKEDELQKLSDQVNLTRDKNNKLNRDILSQSQASTEMKEVDGVAVVDPIVQQIKDYEQKIQNVEAQILGRSEFMNKLKRLEDSLISTMPAHYFKFCADKQNESEIKRFCQQVITAKSDIVESSISKLRKSRVVDESSVVNEDVKKQVEVIKVQIEKERAESENKKAALKTTIAQLCSQIEDISSKYSVQVADFKTALADDYKFE